MEPDLTAILVAANAIHDSLTKKVPDEAESSEKTENEEENESGQGKEDERRKK